MRRQWPDGDSKPSELAEVYAAAKAASKIACGTGRGGQRERTEWGLVAGQWEWESK